MRIVGPPAASPLGARSSTQEHFGRCHEERQQGPPRRCWTGRPATLDRVSDLASCSNLVSGRYPKWPVFNCPLMAGFGCPPRRQGQPFGLVDPLGYLDIGCHLPRTNYPCGSHNTARLNRSSLNGVAPLRAGRSLVVDAPAARALRSHACLPRRRKWTGTIVDTFAEVSLSGNQLAVDLLTGPDREPLQPEQILNWMEKNQYVWRS